VGSTGLWVVGVVPAEAAEALPDDRDPARAPARWSGSGGREAFFELSGRTSAPLVATAAARRFASLVDDAQVATEARQDAQDALMSVMPAREGAGLLVASARKASPVAALFYGLGPAESAKLPGRFGEFVLSADAVRAALPRAEEALRLTGTRRGAVLSRATDWMTAMGDAPDFDTAGLVDGPLRVLRLACGTGCGAAAFSRWY
jgi:hypothetical protein